MKCDRRWWNDDAVARQVAEFDRQRGVVHWYDLFDRLVRIETPEYTAYAPGGFPRIVFKEDAA